MTDDELLQRHLDFAEFGSPHLNYCWFCVRDVNGKDGEQQPHAADCLGVATSRALADHGGTMTGGTMAGNSRAVNLRCGGRLFVALENVTLGDFGEDERALFASITDALAAYEDARRDQPKCDVDPPGAAAG